MSLQEEHDKIIQAVKDNDVTKLEEILNDEVDVNYIGYVSNIVSCDV